MHGFDNRNSKKDIRETEMGAHKDFREIEMDA
jgi:hypothetical protein